MTILILSLILAYLLFKGGGALLNGLGSLANFLVKLLFVILIIKLIVGLF